ncbi:hypothetical protein GOODEAATRI_024164, partial [Goodea atripinnis]
GPDVTPTLYVQNPQNPGNTLNKADQLNSDVCLVTDFHPKVDDVVPKVTGGPVNDACGNIYPGKSQHFLSQFGSTTDTCNDACGGIYPEKAKLNFYLLLMNGVRVVFTKALAFSTVLTIRGLLF